MARFTIGIPTYNRATFLRRSLASALAQTHDDVEVLVCDNASTDDTAEVANSFGSRVRYHRNPTNIGMYGNFAKVAELASGEFVSWLQDDDFVHAEFARRAVAAMTGAERPVAYLAFSIEGPSPTTFHRPKIYGPPVALGWTRDEPPRLMDGAAVVAASLFVSFAIPPSMAFRTDVARAAAARLLPNCILFNERVLLAHAAAAGVVAVDPRIGAVYSNHEAQASLVSWKERPERFLIEWQAMADDLGRLLETMPEDRWRPAAASVFTDLAVPDRMRWLEHEDPGARNWAGLHPLTREVRGLLIASLPEAERLRVQARDAAIARPAGAGSQVRRVARGLTPPLVWSALRGLRTAVAGSR